MSENFFSEKEMSNIQRIALEEVRELCERIPGLLDTLRADPGQAEARNEIERIFHTIGGSAALAGLKDLSRIGVDTESVLRRGPGDQPLEAETLDTLASAGENLEQALANYPK